MLGLSILEGTFFQRKLGGGKAFTIGFVKLNDVYDKGHECLYPISLVTNKVFARSELALTIYEVSGSNLFDYNLMLRSFIWGDLLSKNENIEKLHFAHILQISNEWCLLTSALNQPVLDTKSKGDAWFSLTNGSWIEIDPLLETKGEDPRSIASHVPWPMDGKTVYIKPYTQDRLNLYHDANMFAVSMFRQGKHTMDVPGYRKEMRDHLRSKGCYSDYEIEDTIISTHWNDPEFIYYMERVLDVFPEPMRVLTAEEEFRKRDKLTKVIVGELAEKRYSDSGLSL